MVYTVVIWYIDSYTVACLLLLRQGNFGVIHEYISMNSAFVMDIVITSTINHNYQPLPQETYSNGRLEHMNNGRKKLE
jgi:hypothetical protein